MSDCGKCTLPKKIDNVSEELFGKQTVKSATGIEKLQDNNDTLIKETVKNTVDADAAKKVANEVAPPKKYVNIPVAEHTFSYEPARSAVLRARSPLPTPILTGVRPIVLATHLVPSLPISLFEIFAEVIEAATGKPVVLLHESRPDRPVAEDVTDIAILPAGESWNNGKLLSVSFVFDHRLNKAFSPDVYADVVVATDRAPYVEDIMDLRGHRCALPDRRRLIGATTLLFDHLQTKGEGPAFFGNILCADSQVSALQMVAGKQVEVCILESPVIKYHRKLLPGVYSLHIMSSLGPLPPYPIMINKNMSSDLCDKIKEYLLKIQDDTEWIEKFAPYSVLGFAEYSENTYDFDEMKYVATSVPYY